MDNPRQIMQFIERNNLGYILGNAVRAIIYAKDPEQDDGTEINEIRKLQHLKDARLFLNVEIKRLSKGK